MTDSVLKSVDFSSFEQNGRNCTSSSNNCNDIVPKCNYLSRMSYALKYYLVLCTSNTGKSIFNQFCMESYKQCVDDNIHFVCRHSHQILQISSYLQKHYQFKICNLSGCRLTQRHYERKQAEDDGFYCELFDNLHYFLFHLYDVGLRVQLSSINITKNDNKLLDCNDKIFAETQKIIISKRNKYDSYFNRFKAENNKYNMAMGPNDSKDKDETESTFVDEMFVFICKQNSFAKDYDAINKFNQFMNDEEYDTDSLKVDLEDTKCSNISNHFITTKESKLQPTNGRNFKDRAECVKRYVQNRIVSSIQFSTGFIFWYWPFYRDLDEETAANIKSKQWERNKNDFGGYSLCELYVKKCFDSLKQETLATEFITNKQFIENVVNKGDEYHTSEKVKKIKINLKNNDPMHYGISKSDPIGKEHLYSVILYCDFTNLCTAFSSSFRPTKFNEPLSSIKNRNSKYYWLSRRLREAVQYYGQSGKKSNYDDTNSEIGPFYTGMNLILNMPSFAIRLCQPTSTSKQITVAVNFAKRNGMVIQLQNQFGVSQNLKFWDCSWIGRYKEEDERLFYGGRWRIQIESIRHIETHKNFENFLHAFHLFDVLVSNGHISEHTIVSSKDVEVLSKTIPHYLGETSNTFDKYVNDTFHLFCNSKRQITINPFRIQKFMNNESWIKLIYHTEIKQDWSRKGDLNANLFSPSKIFKLFPNLQEMFVFTNGQGGRFLASFQISKLLELLSKSLSLWPLSLKKIQIRDHNQLWIKDMDSSTVKNIQEKYKLNIQLQKTKPRKKVMHWWEINKL
eukprot:181914_1